MGKTVYKYRSSGEFICSYKTIAQTASDFDLDESTIRKKVNSNDVVAIKGYLLSLRKVDKISVKENDGFVIPTKHQAKILVLDIETAPTKALVWRFWKENINPIQILEEWFIISYSYKWILESGVSGRVMTQKEMILQNDHKLLGELWQLLDEADIIIWHNGRRFDGPSINTRFLKHGYDPPSSYQSIDTLDTLKHRFNLPHNSLDAAADFLGVERKLENDGFALWKRCLDADPQSLRDMLAYNKQDIVVLEDVYMDLRAWIKPHPNLGLFVDSSKEYVQHVEVKICN